MPENLQDSPRPLGEIAIGPSKFEQFLDRNQKGMIVLGVIIAISAGAYIIHRGIRHSNNEDASTALAKASALAEFQAIAKDFPGTPAAGSAELLAAEEQWTEGKTSEAIATLKQFLSANPNHPAEAEAAYQAVIDHPAGRFLAPYALVQLGDLAKTAGDLDKAERLYTRAKSEFPDNHFARLAEQHLLMLKAKPPVEVEAPAAPAKPESGTPDLLPGGSLQLPNDLSAPAQP
jgi:tetratricopeptide (TPR) repeat protein